MKKSMSQIFVKTHKENVACGNRSTSWANSFEKKLRWALFIAKRWSLSVCRRFRATRGSH